MQNDVGHDIIKVQQSVTNWVYTFVSPEKEAGLMENRRQKKGTAITMTIQECYAKMGADYQEVLRRLYNEAMIQKFVLLFLKDDSYQNLENALAAADVKTAFRAAHTLKGVCQNLGFSNLYVPAAELTETLRANRLDGTEEQFEQVKKQYKITTDAIRELAGQA